MKYIEKGMEQLVHSRCTCYFPVHNDEYRVRVNAPSCPYHHPFAVEKDTMDNEETFTQSELTEALRQMSYYSLTGHPLTGPDVIKEIKAHREPQWQWRDVVVDVLGQFYKRNLNGGWWAFGDLGKKSHEIPQRPLTLVSRDGKLI